MINVILSHEVKNFDDWKKEFDLEEPARLAEGATIVAVYNNVDNPNHITVISEFESTDTFKAFLENPVRREGMERAGVIGKPEVKILNKI